MSHVQKVLMINPLRPEQNHIHQDKFFSILGFRYNAESFSLRKTLTKRFMKIIITAISPRGAQLHGFSREFECVKTADMVFSFSLVT